MTESNARGQGQGAPIPDPRPREVGRVFACVLTYNRKDTAILCMKALLAQTRPVDQIVLLDNGSVDGTEEYLERNGALGFDHVRFLRIDKNIGPAAGFSALFEHAYNAGCDWVWVMDDDVIPEPTALEELVDAYVSNFAAPEAIGFLSSGLRTPEGLPNNVPDVDDRQSDVTPARWAELLDRGLARIKWSTFCSDLIPRSTIEKFGFPRADFYYGGDDIDYTHRVTAEKPSYLVGKSKGVHLRAVGKFHVLAETNPDRVKFYYYYYRNQLYLRREYTGRYSAIRFFAKGLRDAAKASLKGTALGRELATTMVRGLAAGTHFRPSKPVLPPLSPATRVPPDE